MNEESFRAIINPWLDRRAAQVASAFIQETIDIDKQADAFGAKGGSEHYFKLAKIPQRLSEAVVEDACTLMTETPGLFSQFQSFERGFFAIFDDLAAKITKKIESPFAIYPSNKWVTPPASLVLLGTEAVTASRAKFAEYVSMQEAITAARLGVEVAAHTNADEQEVLPVPRPAPATAPRQRAKGGRNRPDWYPALEKLYLLELKRRNDALEHGRPAPTWPTDKKFLAGVLRDSKVDCSANEGSIAYHRRNLDSEHARTKAKN